jgi:hypothetical protein
LPSVRSVCVPNRRRTAIVTDDEAEIACGARPGGCAEADPQIFEQQTTAKEFVAYKPRMNFNHKQTI